VRASSVNGWDVYVASGSARGSMEHRYPVVIGKDYSGVVDALGEGATRFTIGEEVAGIVPPEPHLGRGSYAEELTVPDEGFVERKPTSLDFGQAASVGLAATTALLAVEAISSGESDVILVSGATGGVGAYAVELAASSGAHVIATALVDDQDWIGALGASETVHYSGDVVAAVREKHPGGVDALIVAVPLGEGFDAVASLVRDGGRVATTAGAGDASALEERGVSLANVFWGADPSTFTEVVQMAGEGTLTVPIRRTFPFDRLPEALGLVGSRHSRGKFAITIGD
jgi:NADPH2:quinone reductase